MNQLTSAYDLEQRLQLESWQREFGDTAALLDQLRAPRAAVEAFETAAAEIRADANLSEVGRLNRLDETRKKALETVDKWHGEHVTTLDDQITALSNSLAAKLADAPQPSALQVQTLVDRLKGMDATERLSLYASAPDMRTRFALEAASEQAGDLPVRRSDGRLGWERLIDEETIARHREARLRDADPATTAKLRALERRRGVLRALSGRARSLVRDGLR